MLSIVCPRPRPGPGLCRRGVLVAAGAVPGVISSVFWQFFLLFPSFLAYFMPFLPYEPYFRLSPPAATSPRHTERGN